MNNVTFINELKNEIAEKIPTRNATLLTKIANNYYKSAPKDNGLFLELCEGLFADRDMKTFSVATQFIAKRKTVLSIEHFKTYEDWLVKYVDDWWKCDQYCGRVLNPIVVNYPELFKNLLEWIKSNNTYVKRAAPVSLISLGKGMSVNYDIDKVLLIVNKLKHEKHHHIQKAIGWLLKFSYVSYPKQVINYLKSNLHSLSRTSYRYALQKMPKNIKEHMMKL